MLCRVLLFWNNGFSEHVEGGGIEKSSLVTPLLKVCRGRATMAPSLAYGHQHSPRTIRPGLRVTKSPR